MSVYIGQSRAPYHSKKDVGQRPEAISDDNSMCNAPIDWFLESAPCPRRCLVEMPWEAGISEGGITPRFAWSLLVPRLGIFFSLGKNLCGTFLLDSDISGDDGSENKDVGEWISTGDEHIS